MLNVENTTTSKYFLRSSAAKEKVIKKAAVTEIKPPSVKPCIKPAAAVTAAVPVSQPAAATAAVTAAVPVSSQPADAVTAAVPVSKPAAAIHKISYFNSWDPPGTFRPWLNPNSGYGSWGAFGH